MMSVDNYLLPLLPGNLEHRLNESIDRTGYSPLDEQISRVASKIADTSTFFIEIAGIFAFAYALGAAQPARAAVATAIIGVGALGRYKTYWGCSEVSRA
jgi:hypothetical protein